jgi:hypothetical protein
MNEYSQTYGLEDFEEAPVAKEEDEGKPVEQEEEVQEEFEEAQEEHEEEVVDEQEEPAEEEDEPSDIEKEAISKGWRPEGVKGKRPLSAEEFLDRESFYDRIHRLEKQNESLRGTVDEMASQHSKIAQTERENLIKELKEQKKLALAEEDYDKVIDIDDQLAETREDTAPQKETPVENAPNPEFASWQSRNQWYDQRSNPELFEEATTLGYAYQARNPNAAPSDIFDYVEKTIKRMHPEEFEEGGGRRKPAVEGSRTPTKRKRGPRKYTKKDLNDNQRRVMNTYVKRGVMTEDEYISELVKIGEVG